MPMAKLVSTLRPVMFSSELTEIAFSTEFPETVFELHGQDGETLVSTLYYPAADGTVVVYGLDRIIETAVVNDSLGHFSIHADGETLYEFAVLPCPVAVESPASEFLFASFLTSVVNERDSAVGRYECLSVYNPEGLPVNVTASYMDYEGRIVVREFPDQSPVNPGTEISCYNVSPVRFNDFATGELIGIEVSCGPRRQRYRVISAPYQHDPALIFRNCFGCWETIFLCGIKETDVGFTRSAAMINGKFVNYDLEEIITYKASTGPVRYGSDRLARDLARSMDVFLLKNDGTPGVRVTITDCDVKTDNADDTIQSFSFSYRRASLRQTDFISPAPYRIFDNTFDLTYE